MKIKNGMTMFAAAFVLAAALVSAAALPAAAGSWVDINKDGSSWMYLQDDGRFLCRNWLQEGETWYYLDNHGLMVTGRVAINGKYEVFDESGAWLYTAEDAMPAGPGGADGTGGTCGAVGVGGASGTAGSLAGAQAAPAKTEEDLEAESIAAGVLAAITNESMTKPDKAAAIYNWLRANMTYTNNGMMPDAYTEGFAAIYGFTAHRGNCYVYYSMAKYLLGLCDMPSERVVRASDGSHFWNLVNVDGVYYHFDACPRRIAGRWCLVTTAYLQQTSWSAHNFDVAAHPATP